MSERLTTLAEWNRMNPKQQGYVQYMEASRPGSPLPKQMPYRDSSKEGIQFAEGSFAAMLECQDMED